MREKLDLHKLLNYFGLTILILKDAHVEVVLICHVMAFNFMISTIVVTLLECSV